MPDELAIDPTGVTQNHEVERLLNNWIDALSNREKEVLEGRFGLHDREPETLEVLSDRLGLTRERVRQIQNEALLKLKRHMVRNGISKEALLLSAALEATGTVRFHELGPSSFSTSNPSPTSRACACCAAAHPTRPTSRSTPAGARNARTRGRATSCRCTCSACW